MSSFTSSSEQATSEQAGGWRRFLGTYGLTTLLGGWLLASALCLIDPFDPGRFGNVAGSGMPHAGPRLVNASRGRDSRFDSAVIGNSHAQLLMPERLSALTGHRFVTLATPGTGPTEQLVMARWFAAHHGGRIGAMVIGLDEHWCQPSGALVPPNPFPFWLYAPATMDYVAGLLKADTLRHAWRRLLMLVGREPAARADGYDDYDQGRVWRAEEVEARLGEGSPWAAGDAANAPAFPAVAQLHAFLEELPRGTPVSLVFTPMHARALPSPGSPAALLVARCKDAVRDVAAAYGPATLTDFLERNARTEANENFWDLTHYRSPIARVVEDGIAAALPGAKKDTASIP